MKATYLIKKLTELVEKNGDFDVMIPYGGDEHDSTPAGSIEQCVDVKSGVMESIRLGE